jgi:Tfp pilus assembly protein PilV
MRKFRALAGQSLVEVLAAIAITSVVVVALLGLGSVAVRSATASRNRASATSYAQEGIEAVRSIRDRSFSALPSAGGSLYRLSKINGSWFFTSGTETIENLFSRDVRIVSTGTSGKVQVVVNVTWTDNTGSHTVSLDTYLTNWR